MRTLKLTHEQIDLIRRALGIAEVKFADMREEYIKKTVHVRGVDSPTSTSKEADFMLDMENKFSDLLISIENSELDV